MDALPLRDLHLPAPIGWWPPAIGWWLVLGVLLVLVAGGLLWRRWQRRPRPMQRALAELAALEADVGRDRAHKLQALSVLMRRVALTLDPREQVAGRAGADWLRWLDELDGSDRFTQGPGRWLAEAPFRPAPTEAEWLELSALCRVWLETAARRGGRRS